MISVVLYLSAVHQWGTEEVAAWLELICLTEYKEIFIGHDVRGAELLQLERRDLKVRVLTPSPSVHKYPCACVCMHVILMLCYYLWVMLELSVFVYGYI